MLLKKYLHLLTFLSIYLIFSIYFLNFYSHQINPDGISLINIAEEIINGQLIEAINAYWGILFSLLLAPFLSLSLYPLYAEKIMSISIGAFAIIGVYNLSLKISLRPLVLNLLLICSTALVIYFSMSVTTADLLQLTIFLFYLNVISAENYFRKISNGFLVGLLGALGFFAKENGFFFFLFHFTLINIFYILISKAREEKTKVIRTFAIGLFTFMLLSSIWIYLLGLKYQQLMIGSRGSYNWSLIGPKTKGHPRFYMGFLMPPSRHSISAWDDPTYPTPLGWSIFENFETFRFELIRILSNIQLFMSIFNSYSPIFIPLFFLLFLYTFFYIFLKKHSTGNVAIIFIFIAFVTYSSTYIVTYLEERYLWFDFILLILFGCFLLEKFYSSFLLKRLPNLPGKIFYFIIGAAFVLIVSYKPVTYLIATQNVDKFFFDQGQLLLNKYNIINANLASNDNWNWMLYYAFYTNGKYLGISGQNGDYPKLLAEIKKYNVDYYFVWDNDQLSNKLALDFPEVIAKDIGGFRIFFVKNVGTAAKI